MPLSHCARISDVPDAKFLAYEFAGPIGMDQWKSILQYAKDSCESPSAHEGIGLVKEFLSEKSAYLDIARALSHAEVSPGHASVARKLRNVLLRYRMCCRVSSNSVDGGAVGSSDVFFARFHLPQR